MTAIMENVEKRQKVTFVAWASIQFGANEKKNLFRCHEPKRQNSSSILSYRAQNKYSQKHIIIIPTVSIYRKFFSSLVK